MSLPLPFSRDFVSVMAQPILGVREGRSRGLPHWPPLPSIRRYNSSQCNWRDNAKLTDNQPTHLRLREICWSLDLRRSATEKVALPRKVLCGKTETIFMSTVAAKKHLLETTSAPAELSATLSTPLTFTLWY